MSETVATRSSTVEAMMKASQPTADILLGGPNMRSEGTAYLPKFPVELQDDYDARLANTWLFPGTEKARDDFAARIFEKPVSVKEPSERMAEWLANIDLEGRDLSNFAADVFKASLARGISFIMADAPQREGELTRQQVQQMGWRPHLVSLPLETVLGWKWELQGNAPVLTQFRIMEAVADPDRDEYSDDLIEQVRVLDLVDRRVVVSLWQGGGKSGAWVKVDEYATGFDQIYVTPVYTGRTGFFTAKTPLANLTELNLAHWRVQSDKSNCLHKALAPLLFFKQMAEINESGDAVVNSSGFGFTASGESADMKWVEITGAGIEQGSIELEQIRDQMRQVGLQVISEKVGTTTATGDSIEESKSTARIKMWADDLKDALEIALGWMGDIAGTSEVIEVVVNKDFGALGATSMTEVKDMYNSGVISKQTYINEAKRRGVLDEDVDPETEDEYREAEGLDDLRSEPTVPVDG